MIDLVLKEKLLQHFLMIEFLIYLQNVKMLRNVHSIPYVHGYLVIND